MLTTLTYSHLHFVVSEISVTNMKVHYEPGIKSGEQKALCAGALQDQHASTQNHSSSRSVVAFLPNFTEMVV